MTITIYHNPACGTSRNTLAMIRQSGEVVAVVVPIEEYQQLRQAMQEQRVNEEFDAARASYQARREAGAKMQAMPDSACAPFTVARIS